MEKQEKELKEKKSQEIFDKLVQTYSIDELAYFCHRAENLMWKKRGEIHTGEIKSQRKGAILQVGNGSHQLSGERVKLLRKNPKYAEVRVMTGRKYKRTTWTIAYHWLKTELTDLKEARRMSNSARDVSRALSQII